MAENTTTTTVSGNGSEILGRVGTHIFFQVLWKKYNFMHFERHFTFQNA